jgi:hypothetical protein
MDDGRPCRTLDLSGSLRLASSPGKLRGGVMKDVRVDSDGDLRCWNCGNKGLLAKRTFRSKALVGVGALLTKKKLKCQTCGEYNDTGAAKPFTGPKDSRG